MFIKNNENRVQLTSEIIPLENDYEGVVSAAVEYHVVPQANTAVLYIHGYMDYFFQNHLAAYFIGLGISFYAIELRKYGSSIKAHQHQNFFKDIAEYDEEISIVLNKMKQDGHSKIIVNGHSTGGLIATHYVLHGQYRKFISGVILNSPFFEFKVSKIKRNILSVIMPLSYFFPFLKVAQLPSLYTESLHESLKGRWSFNLKYKPIPSFATYLGWVRAIIRAQNVIQKQSISDVPCIIFHSDSSCFEGKWNDNMLTSDMVLNIKDIIYFGLKIYPEANIIEMKNAMHDMALSSDEVINDYFSHISVWLKEQA